MPRKKDALYISCSNSTKKEFKKLVVDMDVGYGEALKALIEVYKHYAKLYNTYDPKKLKVILGIEV